MSLKKEKIPYVETSGVDAFEHARTQFVPATTTATVNVGVLFLI